jgi:pyruvate kinase
LRKLGAAVDRSGQDRLDRWRPLIQRSSFEPSAANLASYLALRAHDLRPLQTALSEHGLSSLGRCEAHVVDSLGAVMEAVSRIAGRTQRAFPAAGWKARSVQHLADQTADIFGRDPAGPRSRIMVTIGADQAHARQVEHLVAAGADCIRINCAHDDQSIWTDIIAQTRQAATALKRG